MIEVVDILVRGETFSIRYDTQRIPLKPGDSCLVESLIGIQMGTVISKARMVKARCAGDHLSKVLRRASAADLDILRQLQELEKDAHRICVQKIQSYRLEMKLVKVMFAFDRSKGLFMFTSEGRVDFRELVRDLAQYYKTRIEMKQIGIRDEARILGGIGTCGFPLCCVTFLRDFHPVSIKMAKDQGLSLIPSKISGLCGRLMCCLQYEHEHYACQAKSMPKIGKRVMTPSGEGRVKQLGILKNTILVELPEGKLEEFSAGDVIPMHKYIESKDAVGREQPEPAGQTEHTADEANLKNIDDSIVALPEELPDSGMSDSVGPEIESVIDSPKPSPGPEAESHNRRNQLDSRGARRPRPRGRGRDFSARTSGDREKPPAPGSTAS